MNNLIIGYTLLCVVVLVTIVEVAYYVIKRRKDGNFLHDSSISTSTALDILNEQLLTGEISQFDYNQRKKSLEHTERAA